MPPDTSEPPKLGVAGSGTPLGWAWLHVAVLWTFAVAQPLLKVLSDSPDFFVARGNTRGDILVLAFALILVVPTVVVLVEWALTRWPRVRLGVHVAAIGLLGGAIALRVLDKIADGPAALLIVLGLAAGAGFGWLYLRHDPVRQTLSVLAPAPLIVLLLFLVFSPVHKLIFPQSEASAKTSIQGRTPVVMLIFDEFSGLSLLGPDGKIDARRFPNFAALARSGTWYKNATTVADHTTRAVPAILSGRRPPENALPIASDYPGSIFTLLGKSYDFADVDEPSTNVCPSSLCREVGKTSEGSRLKALADDLSVVSLHQLLPHDLSDRLPAIDQSFQNFRGNGRDTSGSGSAGGSKSIPAGAFLNRPARFKRFLAGIHAGGKRPPFIFLHIQVPHTAYQYLPSGQEYAASGPETPGINDNGAWSKDSAMPQQDEQRYLLQVGYADRLMGSLVHTLKAAGLYDRGILAVTADHGVSFRPGDSRRSAYASNFPDIASIPMFIKAPNQSAGRTDDAYARTIDIVPTIADLLGVKPGWTLDGHSLRRPSSASPVTIAVYPHGKTTVPFAQFLQERDAQVVHNTGVFGVDWASVLAATTADRGLLGTHTAAVPRAPATAPRAELDNPALYGSIDPHGASLPVFVTGRLTSGGHAGDTIPISINGRIAGLAHAFADSGALRFQGLIPPSSLRAGRITVELFLARSGAPAGLERIVRTDQGFSTTSLTTRNGREVITGLSGRTIPVKAGAVRGFVDGVRSDGSSLTVSCWAVAPSGAKPADRVLVFADGKLLATAQPSVPRPDVVKNFKRKSLLRSGFQLTTVTPDAAKLAGSKRLRVIAVAGSVASNLPR